LKDYPNINFKNLTYGFVELSYVRRCMLLKKYNLLDEEDENKRHVDILEKIIQKAKDNNCLQELYEEIVVAQ